MIDWFIISHHIIFHHAQQHYNSLFNNFITHRILLYHARQVDLPSFYLVDVPGLGYAEATDGTQVGMLSVCPCVFMCVLVSQYYFSPPSVFSSYICLPFSTSLSHLSFPFSPILSLPSFPLTSLYIPFFSLSSTCLLYPFSPFLPFLSHPFSPFLSSPIPLYSLSYLSLLPFPLLSYFP